MNTPKDKKDHPKKETEVSDLSESHSSYTPPPPPPEQKEQQKPVQQNNKHPKKEK